MTKFLVRSLVFPAAFFLASAAHAGGDHGHQHGDADLVIVAHDNEELEIEYPFGDRPTIRVSATILDGVFSSTSPGFMPGEGDGADEFEIAVGTTVEFEMVRREGEVSFVGKNGSTAALPGEVAVIGTHSCLIDVDDICEGGSNAGFTCTDDTDCPGGTCTGECEPDTSDLHQHGEFFLVTADNYTFAEGAITFRLKDQDGFYDDSDEYTLKLSNGPLPALEPENIDAAKDANRCRRAVAKEVRSVGSRQYQMIAKCLDAIFAAEALGRSERAALKACDIEMPACSGGTNDGNFCGSRRDCPGGLCVGNTRSLTANIGKLVEGAVAKLDKACDRNVDGSFGPFTESNIRTHLGMVSCRTQELVGATYAESLAEMTELLSECHDGVCVAGPHKGDACAAQRCDGGSNDGQVCSSDADCPGGECDPADDCDREEIEEAIEEAFPCLKMTQAAD